ncbi:MAG: hypothetical protein ACK48Y_14980 [Planctomyces sp.]
MIRADSTRVKVMANGVVAACHVRCYDRNQLIILPEHRLEALKHHGEAMVIQGSSFRTKVEPPDESSLSRHHFAQTALAASVRAVRHLPETLLVHQQPPLRFPSRLRVRPTACKTPSPRRQSAVSQLQRADLGLESPSYIHSCPFVSIRGSTSPLRFLRVFASSREAHGLEDPLPAAAVRRQPVAEGRSRVGKPELRLIESGDRGH